MKFVRWGVDMRKSKSTITQSEAEMIELLNKTRQQYEEFLKISNLCDKLDKESYSKPNYSKNKSINFTVTKKINAKLV